MGPTHLLDLARTVLTDAPRSLGADRTLAAAILVRQSLEEATDAWWAHRLPAMTEARDRAQQITLTFYLGDPQLAGDVTWAWSRLSCACHHHAYDLPPTPSEIEVLISVVARLVERTADANSRDSS